MLQATLVSLSSELSVKLNRVLLFLLCKMGSKLTYVQALHVLGGLLCGPVCTILSEVD